MGFTSFSLKNLYQMCLVYRLNVMGFVVVVVVLCLEVLLLCVCFACLVILNALSLFLRIKLNMVILLCCSLSFFFCLFFMSHIIASYKCSANQMSSQLHLCNTKFQIKPSMDDTITLFPSTGVSS